MSDKEQLKYQFTKLLDVLTYFEDYPYSFEDEKEMFGRTFAELLLDKGIIKNIDKDQSKINKELQNLEMRIYKFGKGIYPLKEYYINKTKRVQNKREDNSIKDFISSLNLEHYDKTKAGKALGVTRQTIDNWLKKEYLGLKTVKKGAKEVLSKEELIRFYKIHSKN